MGKGGTTSKTKLPKWYEQAAQNQLALGKKVAGTGYVPYMGPEVAAFTPQQQAGMQSSADWNAAFNTPGQAAPNVMATMPKPQEFAGGVQGYSSFGGYKESLGKLKEAYPGLYHYINSFGVNKQTGERPNWAGGGKGGGGNGSGSGGGGSGSGGANVGDTRVVNGVLQVWNGSAWVTDSNPGGQGGSGGH